MELAAVLTPATEGGYVALNPETGATTQGETVEEALNNLREATELWNVGFRCGMPTRKPRHHASRFHSAMEIVSSRHGKWHRRWQITTL